MACRGILPIALLGALLLAATACTAAETTSTDSTSTKSVGVTVFPDDEVADAVEQLPHESLTPMPATRLVSVRVLARAGLLAALTVSLLAVIAGLSVGNSNYVEPYSSPMIA